MAIPAGPERSLSFREGFESRPAGVFSRKGYRAGTSRALAWSGALLPALAWCLIPVVIVTTTAVLQDLAVLSHVAWAVPAAILTAWWWTRFRLQSEIARVYVSGGSAAVLTAWELLNGREEPAWHPVLDLRVSPDRLSVALGDTLHKLDQSDWPGFEELTKRLGAARQHAREMEICLT